MADLTRIFASLERLLFPTTSLELRTSCPIHRRDGGFGESRARWKETPDSC